MSVNYFSPSSYIIDLSTCFQIENVKLEWSAQSKIGSLENAQHKPAGGDKKVSQSPVRRCVRCRLASNDSTLNQSWWRKENDTCLPLSSSWVCWCSSYQCCWLSLPVGGMAVLSWTHDGDMKHSSSFPGGLLWASDDMCEWRTPFLFFVITGLLLNWIKCDWLMIIDLKSIHTTQAIS